MGFGACQDCGVKAKTFQDPADGGLYCAECWTQFYGRPPEARELEADAKPPEASQAIEVALPEDAPRGHPAHHAVKFQGTKKVFSFQWQGSGGRVPFQTTVPAAGNSRWAAEVIARACYMKFEQGWSKEKVLEWRNQCYARLGGRPPSLLASQAASQRGRSRSLRELRSARESKETLQPKEPTPKTPQQLKELKPKELKETKELKAKIRTETFLPPQHLKLLLDDPQTGLPKSEVKIRSQGIFSQPQAALGGGQWALSQSQKQGADHERVRRSRTPQRPPRCEESRGDICHHCRCCRARCDDPGVRLPPDNSRQEWTERVEKCQPMGPADEPTEARAELKRKRTDEVADFFKKLKELKEDLPESQHGPESQPTPCIHEPPVEEKRVVETLPTPIIEAPTPLPQSLPLPVLTMVRETLPTPWATQPTPKVDAANCLFMSDPTPVPCKEDEDAVVPESTQPTPVPPKENQITGADATRQGTVPSAAPESVATVSLDLVAHQDLPGQTEKEVKAPEKAKLNFAALLLQRSRAAAKRQQPQGPPQELKGPQVREMPPQKSKLKVFEEGAPESTHPPVERPPDAYPPLEVRATI